MPESNLKKTGRHEVKKIRRTIRIPEDLYILAEKIARERYWTINTVFIAALKEYIDKYNASKVNHMYTSMHPSIDG